MKWQSKEQLTELLCQLVQYESISGTDGEVAIIEYIHHLLREEEYFKNHPEHLQTHPLDDGRKLLTALVKGKKNSKDTVILLSHIDVVGVEDYGSYKNLAFRPKELTEEFNRIKDKLPSEVQNDLLNGEWLFGRGSMDMKAGTTLQLSLIEQAINGEFDRNLLLLVVPDEEVNSKGMIEALPVLNELKVNYELEYKLCLNSEPMFRRYPNDEQMYIYSGSLGKVLPGFLCYGKETHVGEPFHGLNANLMISYLNINLELNELLMEQVGEEVTPPPISLMNRDLKEHYSVQTPVTAVAMYNVLFMEQSVKTISDRLMRVMYKAKSQIEEHMKKQAQKFVELTNEKQTMTPFNVTVMDYETLYQNAVDRHGVEEVQRRMNWLMNEYDVGDRDFSTLLVQDLAYLCKDLAPMIILFFSPPYYPAVSSHEDQVVSKLYDYVINDFKTQYELDAKVIKYFNGISDLSFIGHDPNRNENINEINRNMPFAHVGLSYFNDFNQKLEVPSINIGPLGKDAHQWTERLELDFSFGKLPTILKNAVSSVLNEQC